MLDVICALKKGAEQFATAPNGDVAKRLLAAAGLKLFEFTEEGKTLSS